MTAGNFRIGYDHVNDVLTVVCDTGEAGVHRETGSTVDIKVNGRGEAVGAVIYGFMARSVGMGKDFVLDVPVNYAKEPKVKPKAASPRTSRRKQAA